MGIVLIVLDVLALVQPDLGLTSLIVAYDIAAVAMGVSAIVFFIKVKRCTGLAPLLSLFFKMLSVMTGLMWIAYPGTGRWC